jgi:heterodisulfide reductase subunit C
MRQCWSTRLADRTIVRRLLRRPHRSPDRRIQLTKEQVMQDLQVQRRLKFENERDPQFGQQIAAMPGADDLYRCLQCGACSGTCPMSLYMDYMPRRIMAMTRAGFKQDVLSSDTIWLCASCYSCAVQCPKEIKITDVMYALKQRAIEEGYHPRNVPTPVLARAFMDSVKATGRSNEGRIVTKMWLKTKPLQLFKEAALGLKLLRKGRLVFRKERMESGGDQMRQVLAGVSKVQAPPAAH